MERELAKRLRSIAKVLKQSPLFTNMRTTEVEWFSQDYMSKSPSKWIAEAVEDIYEAASALDK